MVPLSINPETHCVHANPPSAEVSVSKHLLHPGIAVVQATTDKRLELESSI